MRGDDIDLEDMLGPEPTPDQPENLVDETPPLDMSGKAILARSRSYPIGGLGTRLSKRFATKNSKEKLTRLLTYIAETAVSSDAARRVGISLTTLKYWLQKSKDGAPGDGFDVDLGDDDESDNADNTVRFHQAWDVAMAAGVERVELATMRRAAGYDEVLTYQGRVQYRYDPEKVALSVELGLPENVPQNYLLDEFGAPVPETVYKMDPDLAMFILKSRKPEVYGNKASVDLTVNGGVLVVGMRAPTSETLNELESAYRKEGRPSVTFENRDEEGDE